MRFNPFSEYLHEKKYRQIGETFEESTARWADSLKDSKGHFEALLDIFRQLRFLAGGRVQAAVGAAKKVTPYNCFVSGTIEDSMSSIMARATQAAETMRMGGGIGYDFSQLRPKGDRIVSLDSVSSGPVSFMQIYDAVCKTIASSGHRRGAQMGVLRVDHPDIEEFITAKQDLKKLQAFNISVGVTDEFMRAMLAKKDFPLQFGGKVYKWVKAHRLWDAIMRTTWHYAEPGVLFLDTINRGNPLYYCERLDATNPCGEQPLPANGACLLGSFNLTQYVTDSVFDYGLLASDIPRVVRAMDNVIDVALYPLQEHEEEAKSKRRMGLGVTGVANALERLGYSYGSKDFCQQLENILCFIANAAYSASANLAREKGAFPLFNREKYLAGKFVQKLSPAVRELISKYGLRNSHLLSIAPTGTISMAANNVSSGIEPVFAVKQERRIQTEDGEEVHELVDYGYDQWGVVPKTSSQCSVNDHVNVLLSASKWVDSAVSKTCNIGEEVEWDEFRQVYIKAWQGGAKGCTTFRASGKRTGILKEVKDSESEESSLACIYDPETGTRTCDE